MRKRPLSYVCLLLILLLFLGTLTGGSGKLEEEWEETECTLTGRVYDKEWVTGGEEKKIVYLEVLKADNAFGQMDAEGKKVLCYLKQGQELPKTGSDIRITGKIRNFRKASNPGQFDARSYYRISGISFQINQVIIQQKSEQYQKGKEALFQIRKKMSETFDRQLSPENASLMKTMVLGEKKALAGEIKKRYQRNGIAHLLAISGIHISLIGMALYKALRKTALPVPFCAGVSFLFMYGYGCMTGFSVSSRRALIMFGIQMAAVMLGRTYDLLTAVSLSALLILAEQPWYFYSSSFLFSFGCVLAIGLLIPAMTCEKKIKVRPGTDGKKKAGPVVRQYEKKKVEPVVRQYGMSWKLLESLKKWLLPGCAITAAGLPLQLCFYNQMPVYATLLNLLVIPLMSFLLPCGLLLILVEQAEILGSVLLMSLTQSGTGSASGMVTAVDAQNFRMVRPFSFVITGILGIYEKACQMVENLPSSVLITGRPGTVLIILYLVILLFLVLYQRKIPLKWKWMILLTAGGLLVFSGRIERAVSRQLQVTFLDVGQGDCIVVETPYGQNYVVDCGSTSESAVGEYRLIPFLKYQGIGTVDGVIMTHADEDHISGIRELLTLGKEEGIRVRALLLPDVSEAVRDGTYQELVDLAEENQISVEYIYAGKVRKDNDFQMTCLHPERGLYTSDNNSYSTVLLMEYQGRSLLLTGDIEGEQERKMAEELKKLEQKSLEAGELQETSEAEKLQGTLTDLAETNAEQIDVLKVAHHGSRNSTGEEVLSVVKPKTAILSCGENNSYGHPHAETLERLSECGTRWFCTRDYGAITVTVDRHGRLGIEGYLEGE